MQKGNYKINQLNFFDVLKIIYEKKWIVLSLTLFSMLAGIAYIQQIQPLYRAQVILSAAKLADIAAFNQGRSHHSFFKQLTVEDIYQIFANELYSQENQKQFLQKISSRSNIAYIDIKELPRKTTERFPQFNVALNSKGSPQQSAQDLERYIQFIESQVFHSVLNTLNIQNQVMLKDLAERIEIIKKQNYIMNQHRIAQVQQKLKIAENIKKITPQLSLTKEFLKLELNSLRHHDVNKVSSLLLESLENKQEYLQTLKLDLNNTKVFRQINSITSSEKPVTPQAKKILCLAFFLGFLSSIIGILAQLAWLQFRADNLLPFSTYSNIPGLSNKSREV